MRVLPFTILVPADRSVISEKIELPHFYQYLHRHEEWQLTLVEQGEGTLIAGNSMHAFSSGDIFLVGANLPHLFKSNPDYFRGENNKLIKAQSIYFNPKAALSGLFDLPELKTAGTFLENYKYGFKIPTDWLEPITKQIKQLHHSSGLNLLSDFLSLIKTIQSIDRDVEVLCADVYAPSLTEYEGMRLSRIINFIMRNYHSKIDLEDISNAAYMNPQAFCRYFKKHTGHTFISFLNEVRINDACKKLISDHNPESIANVAYKVGFNSVNNFNRVFKNVKGKTPSEYMGAYNKVSSLHLTAM